jgi:membrane protein DedA with SNARE-associated domain
MPHLFTAETIQHAIEADGLVVLFIVVMLESVGVPLPGETALVTAAVFAGMTHDLGIVSVVALAAAGAIVGDNIGYVIGRLVGLPLLTRYGRYVGLTEARLELGQYLFLAHGGKIVFFGRFFAFLRAFAALLAGTNRMPWPRFLVMNAAGGICWASLFGFAAYFFGEEMKRLAGPVSAVVLAVGLSLVIAGVVFVRRHEAELQARAHKALAERSH